MVHPPAQRFTLTLSFWGAQIFNRGHGLEGKNNDMKESFKKTIWEHFGNSAWILAESSSVRSLTCQIEYIFKKSNLYNNNIVRNIFSIQTTKPPTLRCLPFTSPRRSISTGPVPSLCNDVERRTRCGLGSQ